MAFLLLNWVNKYGFVKIESVRSGTSLWIIYLCYFHCDLKELFNFRRKETAPLKPRRRHPKKLSDLFKGDTKT